MAVTKLAIDLDRRREAWADDERIRCASTLHKFLVKFLVEHPKPGSERRNGRLMAFTRRVLNTALRSTAIKEGSRQADQH
jgi:hypothetical protein